MNFVYCVWWVEEGLQAQPHEDLMGVFKTREDADNFLEEIQGDLNSSRSSFYITSEEYHEAPVSKK